MYPQYILLVGVCMYEYGIIDAQYILVRNIKVQASYSQDGKTNPSGLIRLFLQSIMKLKRDYEFKYPILLWDKKPYYKESVVGDYKGDRWIPTEEEKESYLNIINDKNSTEDEINDAKANLEYIELEQFNHSVQQTVKYKIIDEMSRFGFKSIVKTGFEADDLAYVCSEYINKLNSSGILLSADSDWINLSRNLTESVSTTGSSKFSDLKSYREPYLSYVNNSIYDYGLLYELYWGGHNNITGYYDKSNESIPFEVFLSKMYNHQSDIDYYDEYMKYYEGIDIRPHMNEISELIESVFNDRHCEPSEFSLYMVNNAFSINYSTYLNYVGDYNA